MKINDVDLEWLGHSSFRFRFNNLIIYIDPYQINSSEKADLILITHSHYDHCSQQDINNLAKDGTIILCTPDCQSKLNRLEKNLTINLVEPGKEFLIESIKIKAVDSYNLNKKFHPKLEGWVGYVVQMGNTIVYHAGDCDLIKEMNDLTGYGKKDNFFVALLPIGGMFTMNYQEAFEAAKILKPSLALPIHYGSIIGSKQDAEKFVKLCELEGIHAKILEKSN
jgi:L-ascorbate metabolism protein UlaG (beta-lactamase superfamily)